MLKSGICSVDISYLNVNPELTFDSGQVFRFSALDASKSQWIGVISGVQVSVSRDRVTLLSSGGTGNLEFEKLVRRYFSSEDDFSRMARTFPQDDPYLWDALREFGGLRLLTQDPWECLTSFICSINANIPSIKQKIENLSRRYGSKIRGPTSEIEAYTFPVAKALAAAEKTDLLGCKVGFRWRYIKYIAEKVTNGELDLEAIAKMPYEKARLELISELSGRTFGVGPKVADCALLYSFHKMNAFPMDVWMLKCLGEHYSGLVRLPSTKLSCRRYFEVSEQMRKHFGPNAGYAQLFLYEKSRREGMLTRNIVPA